MAIQARIVALVNSGLARDDPMHPASAAGAYQPDHPATARATRVYTLAWSVGTGSLGMNILAMVVGAAVAAAAIGMDGPRTFLVVADAASQTIVDADAWTPDRNDFFKRIEAAPAQGVANWSGTRLAEVRPVPGDEGMAVFVTDLTGDGRRMPRQSSKPARALELIGWLGEQHRVVIRDRHEPAGQMLRIVGAHLEKDSVIEFGADITDKPGVYRHTQVNRQGAVAYFSVRGNERGDVVVWQNKASRVVAQDVEPSALCWSPDGGRLAMAERGKVSIIQVDPPAVKGVFPLPTACKGAPAWVTSMAWHPDGASIALLPAWPEPDHMPNNPRVWRLDVQTGACTVLVNLTTAARSVRSMDSGGCDTSLEEACAAAKQPARGQNP